MIVAYRGRRGSGKTACMTRDAYISYLRGKTIYSNYHLNFPYKPLTKDVINNFKESDISNCVLLVDEIQVLFNSRTFLKKRNMSFSTFIQQTRKRGVDLFFTTQSLRTVDVNIRENVDLHVYPKPVRNKDGLVVMFDLLYYDPYGEEDLRGVSNGLVNVFVRATPLFKLYDTSQIISIEDD